jgi:hypothetical protein
VLIDAVASRYHCLPSEVLARGDTLDLFILNTAIAIQNYHRELEQAKENGTQPPKRNLSQDAMKQMIQKVRSKNGNKTNSK